LRESDFASGSSALPELGLMTNVEYAAAGIGSTPRDVDGFRLRQFTPDDFEAVHSILSSRDDMTWEHVQATPTYSRSLLDYRIWHYVTYGFGIMAVEDPLSNVMGQAGLQVLSDVEVEGIELVIFLRPDCVGTGLGRKLARYYVQIASECGMSELYATFRHDNARAKALVDRLGFQALGDTVHFGVQCALCRLPLKNKPLTADGPTPER
jgi:RimJ/RimL family protein N-acetyltransferase